VLHGSETMYILYIGYVCVTCCRLFSYLAVLTPRVTSLAHFTFSILKIIISIVVRVDISVHQFVFDTICTTELLGETALSPLCYDRKKSEAACIQAASCILIDLETIRY